MNILYYYPMQREVGTHCIQHCPSNWGVGWSFVNFFWSSGHRSFITNLCFDLIENFLENLSWSSSSTVCVPLCLDTAVFSPFMSPFHFEWTSHLLLLNPELSAIVLWTRFPSECPRLDIVAEMFWSKKTFLIKWSASWWSRSSQRNMLLRFECCSSWWILDRQLGTWMKSKS